MLVDIIGSVVGGILDVSKSVAIPTSLWFSFLIAGLVIAPFLAFNNLRKNRNNLQSQLDSIRDSMPNICTGLEVSDRRFNLVVRNFGGKGADFTANGRVVVGKPQRNLYVMYWEGIGSKCHINGKGGVASILVAERAPCTILRDAESSIYEGELALFMIGTSGEQTFPVHTFVEKPTVINGREGIEIVSEDKCILEVTITSDPPLAEEFDMRKYELEIDHTHGNKLVFTDLLVSSKEEP